ncbi:MAG TPA: TetR/AcrR family transcriptional regulator [Solirubrobacterales bacterium]|jgi:AcrR family transcriptional regulator|nr:TetR/AcrR family transcriptional regulator [Solirubrobacterales bacterium]
MAKLPPALAKESVKEKRLPVEVHTEARREQILALVTKVFAKRGYQAATVDHLVAGGKTSMGGFYKFFDGKEDCFVQAFDRVVEQARERVAAARPGDADWASGTAAGLRALVGFAAEEPLSARVVLLEAQTGGPEAVRRYNETLAEAAAHLRRGRTEGNRAAQLPDSFEDASVSGVVWLLQNRLARGESISVEELYPEIAKTLLEPYIGLKAAERLG